MVVSPPSQSSSNGDTHMSTRFFRTRIIAVGAVAFAGGVIFASTARYAASWAGVPRSSKNRRNGIRTANSWRSLPESCVSASESNPSETNGTSSLNGLVSRARISPSR